MTVAELIKILKTLEQEKEIRHYSYEFTGDFPIDSVKKRIDDDVEYYCIMDGDW